MKQVSIRNIVIPSRSRSGNYPTGSTVIPGGGGSNATIDLSKYMKLALWLENFEAKTDTDGNQYIYAKKPLVSVGGFIAYCSDEAHVPSIFEGIPIDNDTIYWDESTGVRILKAKGSGGGSDFDATAMWAALSAATNEQINKSHLTDAFNGYATESWVEGKGYALQTSLDAVSTKLNDFLEGSDTDTIINKWKELEAFLAGMSETDNLVEILSNKADTSYVNSELSKYVTLATEQEITGSKHFTNGLSVGASKHRLYEQDGIVYFDGDLAVTGGVTAFAKGDRTPSSILDGLIIDENTLSKEGGKLSVIGGVGGASNWDELEGKPSWIGDTKPSYNWSEIGSKPTTLSGYGITDAYTKNDSDNRFVNVSGDTMTGNLKVLDIFIGNNNEINSSNTLYLGYSDTPQGVNVCHNNKPFTYGSSGYTVWHAGNDGVGSGLDADLLDGLHESSFFVTSRGYLEQSTIDDFINRESGTYVVSGPGSSGLLTVFKSSASTSALELYTWYNWSIAKIRMTIDSNRYSEWKNLAFLDSNVASATKLQTARYIFGQSFNGEQDVNGTVKCSSVMSTNIRIECDNNGVSGSRTSEINNYNSTLYLQYNTSNHLACCYGGGNLGIGILIPTYKLDVNGDIHTNAWIRSTGNVGWYSQSYGGGWYMTDSTYIRAYGGKKVYSGNGYLAPYSGSTWITMATRANIIDGDQNQSTDSAHALYRVKTSGGHAVVFGGLYNDVGFYGFYKSRIDTNENGTDWSTTWNATNGTITHRGNFLATGGITCYASDQRAKTVIEQIKLSLKQIANAPTIRFKWNDWKIKDDGKTHIGGIAQYMQKLLPETVLEADDMLNMDYATTGYIFAVQTAKHLVKTDTEVERLKKRVKKLEKQLKQLGYEEVNIMDD